MTAWLLALVLTVNPHLDDGRRLVTALKYEEAEPLLRLATKVPSSTAVERKETFELLARTLAALGKMDACELTYRELLTAFPDAAPTGGLPKLRAAFLLAKEHLFPPDYARITLLPSPPGRVEVEVADPWTRVDTVVLVERVPSGNSLETALSSTGKRWEGSLSAAPSPENVSRGYIEARSQGSVLDRLGSPAEPLVFALPKEDSAFSKARVSIEATQVESAQPGKSQQTLWIGRGLLGTAAVAATVGIALAILSSNDSAAAGQATRAADATGLDDRAHAQAMAANFLVGGALIGATAGGLTLWLGE